MRRWRTPEGYTSNVVQVLEVALHGLSANPVESFPDVVFFPFHVAQSICTYYSDVPLHMNVRPIPCTSWSKKSLARFGDFDDMDLLAQECVIYVVIINPSKIKHTSV